MKPVHLYFFRGLSTYGNDNAAFSIFDFGPVYKNFARAFPDRGVTFHPVTGMGSGKFPEILERALKFFHHDEVWQSDEPVHFLGHSAGGLAARLALNVLKKERPGKVRSLLTIATPNRGSALARHVLDLPEKYRGSNLFLRSIGYDVSYKAKFFKELTAESVAQLFADEEWIEPSEQPVTVDGVRLGSIVCGSPRRSWSLPLRAFYLVKAMSDFREESDGIVETATQPFGQVLAHMPLDHIRQVGIFGKRNTFNEMCNIAANFFKDAQSR